MSEFHVAEDPPPPSAAVQSGGGDVVRPTEQIFGSARLQWTLICQEDITFPSDLTFTPSWCSKEAHQFFARRDTRMKICKTVVDGPFSVPIWGKCASCRADCNVGFLIHFAYVAFDADKASASAPSSSVAMSVATKGEHGSEEKKPWGVPKAQRDLALTASHLRPVAGMASLLLKGVAPADIPSKSAMQRGRRRHLAEAAGVRVPATTLSSSWHAWLQEHAADGVSLPTDLCHFFYEPCLLTEEDDWLPARVLGEDISAPPGACLFFNRGIMEIIKTYVAAGGAMKTGKLVFAVDYTCKLNVSGYGLCLLVLVSKHTAVDHLPSSEGLLCAAGWGPKENASGWLCHIVSAFRTYLQKLKVALHEFAYEIIWDVTTGGKSCHEVAFPGIRYTRDVRHVMAAVKRWGKHITGGDGFGEYVAGNVHFSATCLPTRVLFHHYWCFFMAELVLEDRLALVSHIKTYLLAWDESAGIWTSEWHVCVEAGSIPGHTPATGFQCLERLNGCLKSALPCATHNYEISTATKAVEASITALMLTRGWIHKAEDGSMQVSSQLHGQSWPSCGEAVCPRLLCGPSVQTEKLEWAQERFL